MIHILEIDDRQQANAWFAFDEADFIRKVQIQLGGQPGLLIYQKTTPRQLQAIPEHAANAPELAAQHGWDTLLYRADYMLEQGIYQTAEISELRACLAAVANAHDFRIYPDDATAADALDGDPWFKSTEGYDAGRRLRAQLVEMEVIAEDF